MKSITSRPKLNNQFPYKPTKGSLKVNVTIRFPVHLRKCASILYRFRDRTSYLSKFADCNPSAFGAPIGVKPGRISRSFVRILLKC